MVYTQHFCAKCSRAQIRRNGHLAGHARYQCKACGHQARFVPAAIDRAARYAQVERLLVGRNSQRSIARATGVSRMTVAKLAKKSVDGPPAVAASATQEGAKEALGGARTR